MRIWNTLLTKLPWPRLLRTKLKSSPMISTAGVPGLPTLVTNLIRRGTTLAGLRRVQGTVKGSTSSLLGVLYYGDRAKPAAGKFKFDGRECCEV